MSDCKSATPSEILLSELMDSRVPKNEREHFAAREINRLRARVDDLEARIAEAKVAVPDYEVSRVVNGLRRATELLRRDGYHPEGYDFRLAADLIERLAAAAYPEDVNIDNICNAYESGVGHRGRPTAAVNPYPVGSNEHNAYALGAAGDAPVETTDVCRIALEDACVVSWINADLTTLEGAQRAIASLCAFDVQLATDPATNGGKVLVDQSEAKVADDAVRDAERWILVRERGAYWAGPYAAWIVRLPYAETFEQAADAMLAAKAKEGGA